MTIRMARTVVLALSLLVTLVGACNDNNDRRVRDHDDRRDNRREYRRLDRDRDDDDDDDRRRNRRDWGDDRHDDDDDDRRGYVQPTQQPVIVQQQQPIYDQQQPVYVDEEPVYVEEPRVVVVRQAPPPVIVETVPACPHPGWVWRPGYYRPVGSRFVWIKGSYCAPRHGYVYSQPRYVRSGRGFEFHAAVWKKKH